MRSFRVPDRDGAKILRKSSSLCLWCNNVTDDRHRRHNDRQTDDRRFSHAI